MNKQLVLSFIDAINEHHVSLICSFITEDHQFIDSQGNETIGKENIRSGWIGYFQLFPDYTIEVTDIFVHGDTVAAFGFAGGTYQSVAENSWRLPASWKAVVKNGKIQLWQVYADSKIPYDVISKAKNL
jgi:ketosteroid isomerase-like protein